MPIARMLHRKISISIQVNRLSLPAKLLFTWLISHADDDGKIKGDPTYIRAVVVPLMSWSVKNVEKYLQEMKDNELIYWWKENNELYIEFPKWDDYQQIRADRHKESNLPSFQNIDDNQVTTIHQPSDNHLDTQSSIAKEKSNKAQFSFNKSEAKPRKFSGLVNPKTFKPENEGENIVFETFKRLEPNKVWTLKSRYLKALQDGLPLELFSKFADQILLASTLENLEHGTVIDPGDEFDKKVQDYLKSRNT